MKRDRLRYFMMMILCTLSGCIDPPKSPYIDVRDTVSRIDELQSAAEQGSAEDQYNLGMRYDPPSRPVDLHRCRGSVRFEALPRAGLQRSDPA